MGKKKYEYYIGILDVNCVQEKLEKWLAGQEIRD